MATLSLREACFKIYLKIGSLNKFPSSARAVSSCVTSHQSSHKREISLWKVDSESYISQIFSSIIKTFSRLIIELDFVLADVGRGSGFSIDMSVGIGLSALGWITSKLVALPSVFLSMGGWCFDPISVGSNSFDRVAIEFSSPFLLKLDHSTE